MNMQKANYGKNCMSQFGIYLKSGQQKMMIKSKYPFNFITLHENEGDTVGKTQVLI